MPEATLLEFADHGKVNRYLAPDTRHAEQVTSQFAAYGHDYVSLAA